MSDDRARARLTENPGDLPLRARLLNALRRVFMLRPLERLMASLTRGREPGDPVARMAPNHYQYRRGSLRRVRRRGFLRELDLGEFNDWFVFYGLQLPDWKRFLERLPPDGLLLDVGANAGHFALEALGALGPEARILCFEPFPENVARLRTNLAMAGVERVEVRPVAVGAEVGEVGLHSPSAENLGIVRVASGSESEEVRVEVDTVDRELVARGEPEVHGVKLDVEGFETEVLRGAAGTLERCRPVLLVEVVDANLRAHGSSASELLELLDARGYRLEVAGTGAVLNRPFRPRARQFDVLALPRR